MADLEVTGQFTADQNAHILGTLDVDTNLNVDGNAQVGGVLAVAGEITADTVTAVGEVSTVNLTSTGVANVVNLQAENATVTDTLTADLTGTASVANALAAASSVVNVAAAASPSTGQVLTATDSTHATWQTLGTASALASDTDGTLAANSDSRIATQKAVKTYADTKAPIASPTLTGTPAAPTAAVDTNTTQIATTAMVLAQAASANPLMDGAVAVGTSTRYARADHVHPLDTSRLAAASNLSDLASASTARTNLGLGTLATQNGTAPSGAIVGTTDTQALSNKTLTTPTIADHTNATHTHQNAAGGGTLTPQALAGTVDVFLAAQTASIGSTNLVASTPAAGLYRVSFSVGILASSGTSSIQLSLGWTNGLGGTRSSTLHSINGAVPVTTAMTSNANGDEMSGCVVMLCDNATAITYATTYASTGGSAMSYFARIHVERLTP